MGYSSATSLACSCGGTFLEGSNYCTRCGSIRPSEAPRQLGLSQNLMSISNSNAFGLIPGAMVGLDLNGDGRTDLIVAGHDLNCDGIPDAIQQENGAVFAAPDAAKLLRQVPTLPAVMPMPQASGTLLQTPPTSSRRMVSTGPAKVLRAADTAQFGSFTQVQN